ncbi:MGDG synthase family glycosyltransferase [Peterkaempfera griseoplana]|uniref:MGDG synthase family glycosyltransferase n=1 Tax=Peterkaempfera griseoplana TaxID=66896 RepID=UPI000A830FB4|nr:galactosyldiacylglycerol synthase [Peterkaempfera griseoplana]
MARRFLILSARMGAGHDAVAAELVRRLEGCGHQATRVDVLDLLPAGLGTALRAGYRGAVGRLPWTYAALYRAFFHPARGPRPGSAPLAALAEGRLLAVVRERTPDAVVPVFHLAAQVTGRLRAQGRLEVPCPVVVTDFAVHRQWLHPGNDGHLCVCPAAAEEVRGAGGRGVCAPGPVVPPWFTAQAAGAQPWGPLLRRAGEGRLPVLVSAGAWGTGSGLVGTARTLARAGYLPVVLCGRNERLRRRLARQGGVWALGWVTELPGLLASCAALVDNAAGQTAVQALAAGVPVVGYRPIPGHGAAGVRRMAAIGVTSHARDETELLTALAALTSAGAAREQRIASGRALFAADPAQLLAAAAAAERPGRLSPRPGARPR